MDENIEKYALEMTTPESNQVQELVNSSASELEYIDMLSGNLVGQLLKMLIKVSKARRVLEIGTFTGYSALTMAEVLPEDGEIITIEMNLLYQELAEKHFKKFDTSGKITLIKEDARKWVKNIQGIFDLIFLDADKVNYKYYYEKSLPSLKNGGLLVADNVLWGGKVIAPDDEKSKALHEFNAHISKDERVEQLLLPVRDGITIIQKK